MAHLIQQACFLTAPKDIGTVVPCFTRALDLRGPVRSARLHISALGMYQAAIDGARVGKHCLVGAGAHEDVYANCPIYRSLWDRQNAVQQGAL